MYGARELAHSLQMRTTVEIDDELLQTALRESGLSSEREVVEQSLRALIQYGRRKRLIEAFGNYPWDGNLASLRRWHTEKPG
jgi:Arc/MetJ family transcription regulator